MKICKKVISVILAIIVMLSCIITSYATATSIRMNVSQATIQSGGQYQLSAIVAPSDANKNLQWSSNNTNVATVSSSGLVTGKNSGTATITCKTTDGSNLSASCVITVAQLISSINLSSTRMELNTGNSQRLTVSISPSNATAQALKWSSSNSSVATVDGNGTVTGKSPGTANITCVTTDGSKKSATCIVTVKQGVTSISLNKSTTTVGVGNSTQLTANVGPSNATNKSVSWTTSNGGVAKVNSNGQVVGISPGTATITCKSTDGTNITASCTVTVANVANGNNANTTPTPTQKPNSTKPNASPSQAVTQKPSLTEEKNNNNIEPEDTGETIELPNEEFEKAVDDIFSSEENQTEEKKYDITDMLQIKAMQSKKDMPLTISWSAIKGFTGYEVYVAVQKNKKAEITDNDYYYIGDVTGSYYEIINLESNRTYYVKLRTYMIDEETGEKELSDFTTPIKIKTKRKSVISTISSWFTKIY